jgi:hypothetical protein
MRRQAKQWRSISRALVLVVRYSDRLVSNIVRVLYHNLLSLSLLLYILVTGQVAAVLDRIGCTSSNTLFAQSICPDEINHEEDGITRLFQAHLGEVFHMGGLAGISSPFTSNINVISLIDTNMSFGI